MRERHIELAGRDPREDHEILRAMKLCSFGWIAEDRDEDGWAVTDLVNARRLFTIADDVAVKDLDCTRPSEESRLEGWKPQSFLVRESNRTIHVFASILPYNEAVEAYAASETEPCAVAKDIIEAFAMARVMQFFSPQKRILTSHYASFNKRAVKQNAGVQQ